MPGTPFNDLAVRDLDGDGQLDVVVIDELGNAVKVLHGNGDGSFAAPQSFATGAVPNYLGIGDFDSDHRLDLVTTSVTDPGVGGGAPARAHVAGRRARRWLAVAGEALYAGASPPATTPLSTPAVPGSPK